MRHAIAGPSMPEWEVHPLTPARWPDLVDLFSRRGPRGGRRNGPRVAPRAVMRIEQETRGSRPPSAQ